MNNSSDIYLSDDKIEEEDEIQVYNRIQFDKSGTYNYHSALNSSSHRMFES